MRSLAHKIRSGVIELRTDIGLAYARPSFWQRIYLLWTFRNFHRLPKEVLNSRQLKLINKLCWSATTRRHELTIRTSIIGSIENVCLMRIPRLEVQSITTKVPQVSVASMDVALPRAAGSEGMSVGSSPSAHNHVRLGDLGRPTTNVWSISASRQQPVEESEPKEALELEVYRHWGRRPRRNRLAWVLAGAFGTVLLGSFFYFRDVEQADITVQEDAVMHPQSASASISPAAAAQPEKIHPSVPARLKPPVANPVVKPESASSTPKPAITNPVLGHQFARSGRTPPVTNPVLQPESASSSPKPAATNPVLGHRFATSAPIPPVANPVLQPPAATSTRTQSSPASSLRQLERHGETAILSRPPLVIISPTPEGIPQVAETPEPGFRYPVAPNRALRGRVSLKAVVGVDGNVKQLTVLDGSPALVAAAVRAVRHWHYRPYEIKGQTVEVKTNITFNFLGRDAVSVTFPAEP
jgi:TonB family protein